VTVTIGRGQADFERARAALLDWKQFDIGWVEMFPRHASVAAGTIVAVLIRHLRFWSLNGCRVLYTLGSPGDAKLLTRNVDEIAMVRDAGLAADVAGSVVTALGILELSFAAALLVAWHRRWPLFVCLSLMLLATAAVGMNSPRYFGAAFNPFTLNLAVACLASIDLLVVGSIPSAARCLRRPGPEKA
jgi:hypothetical protein